MMKYSSEEINIIIVYNKYMIRGNSIVLKVWIFKKNIIFYFKRKQRFIILSDFAY